jgi:phenylpyruvate tautomerase PptA (4-oxalocrotonate tautomerase family)
MPKYNILLFGTMYTGNTKKELADNANVTISTLNKLLKDDKRRLVYNLTDKTVEVIDIKNDNKYSQNYDNLDNKYSKYLNNTDYQTHYSSFSYY